MFYCRSFNFVILFLYLDSMARSMKQKQLESYLDDVDVFEDPKLELEQYPTTPHLAGTFQGEVYFTS